MDTPARRGNGNGLYSSSGSDRYHGHKRYHPYKRSDRGYLLDEFKKPKPPKFYRELKKLEDEEVWLLGMKNFFELHDYIENVKAKIIDSSFKGKANIWWEDVKQVRDI